MSELRVSLSDEDIDRIADTVVARLVARHADAVGAASPWLTAEEASGYLRCTRNRLAKLTMLGELEPQRDGRRVLYRRADLDAYIARGGASTGR